jgi:short-subunit dehydrogenase
MKELIMIAAASSGLGYEMSKLFAEGGFDLVFMANIHLRMIMLLI